MRVTVESDARPFAGIEECGQKRQQRAVILALALSIIHTIGTAVHSQLGIAIVPQVSPSRIPNFPEQYAPVRRAVSVIE